MRNDFFPVDGVGDLERRFEQFLRKLQKRGAINLLRYEGLAVLRQVQHL
jgi:hypothetical protein